MNKEDSLLQLEVVLWVKMNLVGFNVYDLFFFANLAFVSSKSSNTASL